MFKLDELTRADLMKDVERKVMKRASKLNLPRYLGITRDYVVKMAVDSSTGNGYYVVQIKLDEYPSIASEPDMTTKEKVRLALAGDMKIHCECPAFRFYGYEYITTQIGSNSGSIQNIYPIIRNPNLIGIMCKHCYRAFRRFGSFWSKIAKDIEEENFIR